MIPFKKTSFCFLLVVIVVGILVHFAVATTVQFTVPSGEEVPRTLNLAVDDHVLVSFTVVGQTESTLDFWITDPNGNVTAAFSRQGDVHYSFVCVESGDYVLHFSNVYSSQNKFVALDYEIQHYILGIPQMLFLTVIIAVVCVAMVAVFILMGKPH